MTRLTAIFEEIIRVEVDPLLLANGGDEHPYMEVAVELLKEAGSYLIASCSIYRAERLWDLREAAICGNGIRLFKLIDGFLDQTCKHRRELSDILGRLIFETAVGIRYLVLFGDEPVINSYLRSSFRFERRLIEKIDANIADRGGEVLPIETRMRDSIERMLAAVGFKREDLSPSDREWGSKNLFEKCEAIGWGEVYLAFFAGLSGAVHGSWTDLQMHHLRVKGVNSFEAVTDWSRPRPQILFSTGLLVAQVCSDIASIFDFEDVNDLFVCRIEDYVERVELANNSHEIFLQNRP